MRADSQRFRSRLESIVDARHPLIGLATQIDRRRFDEAFDALYKEVNRYPFLDGPARSFQRFRRQRIPDRGRIVVTTPFSK